MNPPKPSIPPKPAQPSGKLKREYQLTKAFHQGQEGEYPLYGIAFNNIDERFKNFIATAGSNRVTVYECLPWDGVSSESQVRIVQSYADEDKSESFYTICWTCDSQGLPLLAASGLHGVIRIISCCEETLVKTFIGHGNSVNELQSHVLKPNLLLSASKDESVRLWNVETGVCILVFAGAGGHRNEVLSVDFHPADVSMIITSGMDSTVKIWCIQEYWHLVDLSCNWGDRPSSTFPTKYVQYPLFKAKPDSVHDNYVDCSRWLGDYILSKSVTNQIILWRPRLRAVNRPGHCCVHEEQVDILQRYPISDCDIWFIKFAMDFHHKVLAVGNKKGKVFVFDVHSSPPVLLCKMSNNKNVSAVRQTTVSYDGSMILCCYEDGGVCRWDARD